MAVLSAKGDVAAGPAVEGRRLELQVTRRRGGLDQAEAVGIEFEEAADPARADAHALGVVRDRCVAMFAELDRQSFRHWSARKFDNAGERGTDLCLVPAFIQTRFLVGPEEALRPVDGVLVGLTLEADRRAAGSGAAFPFGAVASGFVFGEILVECVESPEAKRVVVARERSLGNRFNVPQSAGDADLVDQSSAAELV